MLSGTADSQVVMLDPISRVTSVEAENQINHKTLPDVNRFQQNIEF